MMQQRSRRSNALSRWVGGLFFLSFSVLAADLPATSEQAGQTAAITGVTTFETRLGNGMRVIVREDRRAPTVAHMVWYQVGSMDEVSGTTGVAHALEHMMFKGTPNVGPGEFSRRVAAAGGRDNAFTSQDYTAYFQQIPSNRLAEMMELESDRMRHLTLDAKEFSQEIRVIQEERRMRTEDEPTALLREQTLAVAFQAHPYRNPIIGWMSDLHSMTVDDLKLWHTHWVRPNNAILVIVGDVDHKVAFDLAEKTYGKVPSGALGGRKPQNEPEQRGVRRLVVKAPADLPEIMLLFKVPALRDVEKDDDVLALDILSTVLSGHSAARLPRRLVKEGKLAIAASMGCDTVSRGPGYCVLSATPAPGHSVAELETALRREVAEIARDGIRPEELERTRVQLMASQVYKRDSMFGQAMEIGHLETLGYSYRVMDRLIERLQQVTAAQVQDVAKKYFGDDQLTIGVLEPQAVVKVGK